MKYNIWSLPWRTAVLADPSSSHTLASMPRVQLPRCALPSTLTPLSWSMQKLTEFRRDEKTQRRHVVLVTIKASR